MSGDRLVRISTTVPKEHQQQLEFPSEPTRCSGWLWWLWRHLIPSDRELHTSCRPGDGSHCICTFFTFISKMYFGHWEPLGVSESCRTRITGWSNPRVYWTDVLAFKYTWKHLGACWITAEQSAKNIFFGNDASAPGNHSYCISFNDFQNLCFQFVFWSVYLCIYIATYLHTLCLDWQHVVIESNSTCAWRWRLSELRDTLRGHDRANLEM